jgi:DNA topoisomerase-3
MRLDDVVVGKAGFRTVIDEIAGEADRLITILRQHSGGTVDVSQPLRARRGRSRIGRKRRAGEHAAAAASDEATPKVRRRRRARYASHRVAGKRREDGHPERQQPTSGGPTPPTSKMVAFAKRLAKQRGTALPSGYDKDFSICRRFLDRHTGGVG